MFYIAIRMLTGDRAKYLGILMGLTFASLLITQQLSIFVGLMSRTYGAISDLAGPDLWVMDTGVRYIDDFKAIQDTAVSRVKGIDGIEWAVPLYRGQLKVVPLRVNPADGRRLPSSSQNCFVLGLDDPTLIGGPPEMVAGDLADLRETDAVIVDEIGASTLLAAPPIEPGGKKRPLAVGDELEVNDKRVRVVGICRVSRNFATLPVLYTTYTRALRLAPPERKLTTFVLAKTKPGADVARIQADVAAVPGLKALTAEQFKQATYDYYFESTGIPINFGIAVALGFIIGTAIAGQTFYNFTHDNLKHFGSLKAMGASDWLLLRMILLQSALTGFIGYGLGVGLAALFGRAVQGSELAFRMPWQLLLFTGGSIVVICLLSALISIRKVMALEPAVVFKG
jgi:putative ABC transport system permease protein